MDAKTAEAISIYGSDVVSTVIQMVEMSDPDGAHTMFEDEGMFQHAECVEFLFFEE